jgi:hypothetical protein
MTAERRLAALHERMIRSIQEGMARNRRHSTTRRVAWASTMAEDVGPGDLLPWGVVSEKTWGGPIGIDAWRVVVREQVKPIWLKARRPVICRRAATPAAAMTHVQGVVASSPTRADSLRGAIRTYLFRNGRLRRAV